MNQPGKHLLRRADQGVEVTCHRARLRESVDRDFDWLFCAALDTNGIQNELITSNVIAAATVSLMVRIAQSRRSHVFGWRRFKTRVGHRSAIKSSLSQLYAV